MDPLISFALLIVWIAFIRVLRTPRRTWTLLSLAGACLWTMHSFLFRIYWVTSASMEPTLLKGDVILVQLRKEPRPGSVVVFGKEAKVKRWIAGEGETVELLDNQVLVNNTWMPQLGSGGGDMESRQIGPKHFFVLGDNRDHSRDSRHYGDLAVASLAGVATHIIWPPRRVKTISRLVGTRALGLACQPPEPQQKSLTHPLHTEITPTPRRPQ